MQTRRSALLSLAAVPVLLGLLGLSTTQDGATAPAESRLKGKTVVITGANRGLGLEFAKQYVAAGANVIGTARKPKEATELAATGARVLQLDVADEASVDAFAEAVGDAPVALLVNNAGVSGRSWAGEVGYAELTRRVMDVNTLGPMRVTEALLPNLTATKGGAVVNVSSRLGSIASNTVGKYSGYRESKAALNMYSRSLAFDHADEGLLAICVSPGWVKTDMGGPDADLTPEESITGLRGVIETLDEKQSGLFLNHDGTVLEW